MVTAATNLGANAAKRYLEINTSKATRATEELASGSRAANPAYDPSSSAVGYRLTSNLVSLGQSSRNVTQAISLIQMATGALGATQDVLTRMKEITVSANTNTVGDNERAMMNQEFQRLLEQVDLNATNARWGGVSLFTGGGGTATASGIVAEGATGLTAVANAFANTLNANSQGLITGVATDATVTQNGGLYDVTVKVGTQTFKATTAPTASGTLSLVSTTDPGNVLVFDYAASVAGITNAATFQTALRSLLGVDTATKATFSSLSTSAAGMPNVTLTAGSGTNPGTWALTYTGAAAGGTGMFKLTRGDEVYTASVTTAASMTGTVSFGNGVSLALATFDGTANAAQETYNIVQGSAINMQFQYAEKASDVLSITFNGANVSALGLSGISVDTTGNAQTASSLIDTAIQTIGQFIANLGGKASQLNYMSDTLKISMQNQEAARSTFIDANIAQSMMTLQRFKGLGSVASTVFTQSLNQQSELAQMVGNVR